MQFTVYSLLVLCAFVLSVTTMLFSEFRRTCREHRYLFLLMLAASVWSLNTFLASIFTTIPNKLIFARALYLGVTTAPVFYLLFVLQYTQSIFRLKTYHYLLLFSIPAITVLAVFTNGYHHLFWKDIALTEYRISGITAFYSAGPLLWLIVAYSNLVIIHAFTTLLFAARRFPRQYKGQILIIFLCMVIPLGSNLFYVIEKGRYLGADMTAVTFSIAAFLLLLGITRHGLLKIKPLARDFLFESMKDGILFMDNNQEVIDCNTAASRILNFSAGHNAMDRSREFKKHYPELCRFLNASGSTTCELNLPRETDRIYLVTLHKLEDQWSNRIGKVIVLQDITEQKKFEEIIHRQNEELKRMNQQKDKMISIISHDLRSPFASIIGLSELMRMNNGTYSDEKRLQFLDHLISRARRTYDLLENLLQWAKSNADVFQPSYGNINLKNLVTEVVADCNPMACDKKITIKVEKELKAQPGLSASNQSVSTVLRNLITNAIKYTGINGLITIHYQYLPDHCLISVSDTGIGIPPESVKNLFQAAHSNSTRGTNGEEGSGLGLALCKEIIEKSGGKIWISSMPGNGTTVYFTLPYSSGIPAEFKASIQSMSKS